MGFLIRFVAFFLTLIFEVLLAMTLYMFIKLNFPSLFAWGQDFARTVLEYIRSLLATFMPSLAEDVNVNLAGDLSDNAMLLLLLGLCASGIIRVILWSFSAMARRR